MSHKQLLQQKIPLKFATKQLDELQFKVAKGFAYKRALALPVSPPLSPIPHQILACFECSLQLKLNNCGNQLMSHFINAQRKMRVEVAAKLHLWLPLFLSVSLSLSMQFAAPHTHAAKSFQTFFHTIRRTAQMKQHFLSRKCDLRAFECKLRASSPSPFPISLSFTLLSLSPSPCLLYLS